MAVEAKSVRKVVVSGWDNELAKGTHVSIHADGDEVRTGVNDGEANLYFPMDFEGDVDVEVRGSSEGSDVGTINVTADIGDASA